MRRASVYLGFDLGASSGRAVLGFLNGGKLRLQEIHRFANEPVPMGRTLYWSFPSLWWNVCESLRRCAREGHHRLDGIGVDTWGVDFGLLDRAGQLLSNPVHYRDARTEGVEAVIGRKLSDGDVYRLTGMRIGRVSTLAQLVALRRGKARCQLDVADKLLMMSDLIRYFLCGDCACELTAVGSSVLTDVKSKGWAQGIFKTFDLPVRILPPIRPAGAAAGRLFPEIAAEAGIGSAPVIITPGHDTASAAAAVPFADPDTAFVSCGTWAVLGVQNDKPILTETARRAGFINELGFNCILFVKNLAGLHLFEGLRRTWSECKNDRAYRAMLRLARKAKPFSAVIDSNASHFFSGQSLRQAVSAYLRATGQRTAVDEGSLLRGILEGLAFSFRKTLRDLAEVTGRAFRRFCVVGGGVYNELLCQMIADATGLQVVAGPAEAAVTGNLAVQAMATGRLKGLAEIRELVRNSSSLKTYMPKDVELWNKRYERCHGLFQA